MKNLKILYLLTLAFLLSLSSYSQERALTNIQKNINKQAAGLEQTLNFTLDTLTLKSDKNILRVTFLSHDEKDSVIIDVDAPEIKIPLYHFKKGRYTIAVYREDKIIALGVKRVEHIPVPKDAIADLEESILRSSLSEEEQIARNIKPLKKKPKVVKNPDTRVAVVKQKVKREKTKPKRKDNIDSRVAVAKPKVKREKKPTTKKPLRTRKQREPRVVSNVNKKSALEIAAEREEEKKAIAEKNKKVRGEVASLKPERKKKPTTLIEVTKVTYNLTQKDSKSIEKQSRADYRANNLRPNGTRYEN